VTAPAPDPTVKRLRTGDFLMSIQELACAATNGIAVVFLDPPEQHREPDGT